ncbi:MAG: hypothetical protein KDJ35_06820 [Alphaproteobacteria bacterium]|nr:hypothetical protein [Alphaproteobacteria bacterium]
MGGEWLTGKVVSLKDAVQFPKLPDLGVLFNNEVLRFADTPGANNATQLVGDEVSFAMDDQGLRVVSVLNQRDW